MCGRQWQWVGLVALPVLGMGVGLARGGDTGPKAAPPALTGQPAQQTIERALNFLETDAAKWKAEKEWASCHQGTMTAWALNEAKNQGYAVPAKTLADMTAWAKARALERIDQPRDPRPGWKLVNLAATYLAVASQAAPGAGVLSPDERRRVAGHVARHQEADGSWAVPPPKNGPPPVFESAETNTLWASLALEPFAAADGKKASPLRDSRDKASAWLSKAKPSDSTQVRALRLLLAARAGQAPDVVKARADELLALQRADGGWGQVPGAPTDAYASGQALYALSLAGVSKDRREVQRGVTFLVGTQRPDGSWPMKSRAQPGEKPFTNPSPITYFGSAWATLGLVRCVAR